jgi:hypothetical protein
MFPGSVSGMLREWKIHSTLIRPFSSTEFENIDSFHCLSYLSFVSNFKNLVVHGDNIA